MLYVRPWDGYNEINTPKWTHGYIIQLDKVAPRLYALFLIAAARPCPHFFVPTAMPGCVLLLQQPSMDTYLRCGKLSRQDDTNCCALCAVHSVWSRAQETKQSFPTPGTLYR